MKTMIYIFLMLPIFAFSQNTISVNVYNVSSTEGSVNVAVYDSHETFLKFEGVVKTVSAAAATGMVTLAIHDMPSGEYALAVFHDENGNDELDTNWLGIPKERVAFSKAKMKNFGPPKYKECCFKVTKDTEVSITF